MPYREKIAWLSLIAIALTYGPYFVITTLDPPAAGELPNLPQLWRFALTAVAQMVILLGGRAVLAARIPRAERGMADERDRSIERRTMRVAYFTLIGGAVWAGVVLPFVASGWTVVNTTLAAIVLSEVVQYTLAIRAYRVGLQ